MKLFDDVYRGKRVLVTGHSGFKGAWLTLWLKEMGAEVIGVSLPLEAKPNHWNELNLNIPSYQLDIRNLDSLENIFNKHKPEIIFHLAAQPLVRRSYQKPIETWTTNVIGTVNILELCRQQKGVEAIIVVTTDKCYENLGWPWGYRENDRLGGYDPYSASKAAVELVVNSYRSSFFDNSELPLIATARAGNVIGGGDWSDDRLIPDLIRAVENGQSLKVRYPLSTRPWQHVLESLSGYLLLGQKLLLTEKTFGGAWNFGPGIEDNYSVAEVLDKLATEWNLIHWHADENSHPYEAKLLYLDSTKAHTLLGWRPVWNIDMSLIKTLQWYQVWLNKQQVISVGQLKSYINDAAQAKVNWIK